MFGRILIGAWIIFWGLILLVVLFPRLFVRIPHIQLFKPFMIALTLVSMLYGVVWLYRQGMKSARSK